MIPFIEMRNIYKTYANIIANNDVSLTLYKGEAHAIVGENGAGKSTLMKILYGQVRPESGKILIDGEECSYDVKGAREKKIGMVYQNFMQIKDMSILENIILGNAPKKNGLIDYKSAEEKISQYLKRFKLKTSPNAKIRTLSVGERQKIEIIKTLYFDAKVLILDEPTAVLTPQESYELFDIIDELKSEGCAVVFISHKLREVVQVADRITVMRKGKVVKDNWLRGEVGESDIARAMIGKNDVELIANKRSGVGLDEVLRLEDINYFDDLGVLKLKNFSLSVKKGEILGVGGVEGNGQSELVHILIGLLKEQSGRIFLEGEEISSFSVKERRDSGMSYISEDRMSEGLLLDGNISENIAPAYLDQVGFRKWVFINYQALSEKANELRGEYNIAGLDDKKAVKDLSGGNMQKVVLAREISTKPKLIIASQPTRGLDIGAINSVREILLREKERGAAIILVSADLEELLSLSDRLIIMFEGKITGEIKDFSNVSEEQIGLMMGGLEA